MESKERDYYFDNLKAVLIFLVVLGHFLLPIHNNHFFVILKRLIYVFHMPLFVFVSGYFSKKVYANGQMNFHKILYLLKAYILFVLSIQVVYVICGFRSFSEINFFSQSGAPWYLFAMIAWYLTIPLIQNIHPSLVLCICVWAALISGFFSEIGDFLCLSRILVFSIFFYLGYFTTPDTLQKILNKKLKLPVTSAAIVLCIFICVNGRSMKDELQMVYENISYYELDQFAMGPLIRLNLLIAALLLSWATMFYIPNHKTCISYIGSRTMPVYILHRLIRDVIMFSGIYDYVENLPNHFWSFAVLISIIIFSAILTWLLSNTHITNYVNHILRLHFV